MKTLDPCSSLRVAVLDRDREFSGLLCAHARELSWKATPIAALPSPETLTAMRLDVLLVDVESITSDVLWLSRQALEMPRVTVFVCSRGSTVAQRVQGLREGLDGWIDKDCHPHEVLARIQATVRARRGQRTAARPPVRSGELHVDATRYDAIAGGRSAGLTTREFEVFALLVENKGTVLTREHIYAGVWGSDTPAGGRSVDIFISRIRLKLRRISPSWSYLHTHVGAGYRFEAERDLTFQAPVAIGLPVTDIESIAA